MLTTSTSGHRRHRAPLPVRPTDRCRTGVDVSPHRGEGMKEGRDWWAGLDGGKKSWRGGFIMRVLVKEEGISFRKQSGTCYGTCCRASGREG